MFPITGFTAAWRSQTNKLFLEIKVGGQVRAVPTPSAEIFTALLAILNGPNPALDSQGDIISQR